MDEYKEGRKMVETLLQSAGYRYYFYEPVSGDICLGF
jgi:hypothetical protein